MNDNSDKTIGELRECKEKGGLIGTDTVLVRFSADLKEYLKK